MSLLLYFVMKYIRTELFIFGTRSILAFVTSESEGKLTKRVVRELIKVKERLPNFIANVCMPSN